MLARFRKMDYWNQIEGIEGFHRAVEKLGSSWRQLEKDEHGYKHGYTDVNSIWGQLANLTELKNKHTYEARKWLYNAWHQDRQQVRTQFLAKMLIEQVTTAGIEARDNAEGQHEMPNPKVLK